MGHGDIHGHGNLKTVEHVIGVKAILVGEGICVVRKTNTEIAGMDACIDGIGEKIPWLAGTHSYCRILKGFIIK